MIVLTYWEDPPIKRDPVDFDGIRELRIKSVREIPALIESRPPHCTMISTEHSAMRKLKSGLQTNFFKMVWNGEVAPTCPYCGQRIRKRSRGVAA